MDRVGLPFEEIWTQTHACTERRQWEEPQGKGHGMEAEVEIMLPQPRNTWAYQ